MISGSVKTFERQMPTLRQGARNLSARDKRRQKTREWLRHREHDSIVAPSIVPKAPEKSQRIERKRSYSQ
jgi:hypothetical protein